jgi:adenine deaminase
MNGESRHSGTIVDIIHRRCFPGVITVRDGIIISVEKTSDPVDAGWLCPGFVDAHVHIESSMLTPPEFGRIAVTHGTIGTVSDPHEIANVLGVEGVRYMLDLADQTPLKIHFGIPSCVPATGFETAGAVIGPDEIEELCREDRLGYLSEMMNFPGVVHGDADVMRKLEIARRHNKPVDGHAPGLGGDDLRIYAAAGISTDHECLQIAEAREKLALGMKILIREGSAAKNFDELQPLISEHPDSCMLCSDDKHPDDLMLGHIDRLCARAVGGGAHVFDVLQVACVNPVHHYRMRCGLLRPSDAADFIRLGDLSEFTVMETWIDGRCVARDGQSLLPVVTPPRINRFHITPKRKDDFIVTAVDGPLRVIEALNGQIVTDECEVPALVRNGMACADPSRDLLKITVVNRYEHNSPPAVGFVRGFGLHRGAIASSVAHDCHNLVAVGADDDSLARAVNLLIQHSGGICAVDPNAEDDILPLPVAGLMSDLSADQVAEGYARLTRRTAEMGSTLTAPFMTLSFMPLLVIPKLKLSDLGLFDGASFKFVPLFRGNDATS